MRHLPRSGNFTVTLPNGSQIRLWSRGQEDWVENQLYWHGWTGYEPEALPLFYALAERAGVILDIGANVGLYSLVASCANPKARVFAFEPLPSARERLIANILRNALSNIDVIPSAVSNHCGRQAFYCVDPRSRGIPTTSSLSHDFATGSIPGSDVSCLQVDVTTIDDFCQQHRITDIGLAKLDIETLEPQAIDGMRHVIRRSQPHLLLEILPGRGTDTVLDGLARQFGYNVFALDVDGPHFQPHIMADQGRTNYLFTRMSIAELHRFMNTTN